jgi:hypothetical protein
MDCGNWGNIPAAVVDQSADAFNGADFQTALTSEHR